MCSVSLEYKRGDSREDGMIFWGYQKNYKNGEYWVSSEKFNHLLIKKQISNNQNYQKNKEKINKRSKLWAKINREKCNENSRNWKRKNKHNVYPKTYLRIAEKRKNNPISRLNHNLGNNLRKKIKSKFDTKTEFTKELFGCSGKFLIKHLEEKFVDGMNWGNYGSVWHIDHIIPTSIAKTKEDLYKLYHYTNLQPLFALENIKKGNKINDQAICKI